MTTETETTEVQAAAILDALLVDFVEYNGKMTFLEAVMAKPEETIPTATITEEGKIILNSLALTLLGATAPTTIRLAFSPKTEKVALRPAIETDIYAFPLTLENEVGKISASRFLRAIKYPYKERKGTSKVTLLGGNLILDLSEGFKAAAEAAAKAETAAAALLEEAKANQATKQAAATASQAAEAALTEPQAAEAALTEQQAAAKALQAAEAALAEQQAAAKALQAAEAALAEQQAALQAAKKAVAATTV